MFSSPDERLKFLVCLFLCMVYHKNRPYTGCHKIAAIKHHEFAVQWYYPLSKVEINLTCTVIKRSKSDVQNFNFNDI